MRRFTKNAIISIVMVIALFMADILLNISSVNAAGVSLNKKSVALKAGKQIKLKVKAKNVVTVVWSSSDNTIATVDTNGIIYAKTAGKTTVSATIYFKNRKIKIKKCKVVVKKGKSIKTKGLWVSDSQYDEKRNYGMYFMDDGVLLIGWVIKDSDYDSGYFIKGNPYEYNINSNGIHLTAGYRYGSDIVHDEEEDGIPQLKYDGKKIIATGGEIDGMVFSYISSLSDYTIDY